MRGFLLKTIFVFVSLFSLTNLLNAQCGFNNTNNGNLTPPGVGLSATATASGGFGYQVNVCAGAQYTASTCGTSSFDTYLTVFNAAGNAIAWNDDACGNQSSVTWTSTYSGTAWVFIDRWASNGNQCSHTGTGQPISVTQNTACVTTPASNCGAPTVVTCGGNYNNHTTIGAGNDVNTMSCHLDGGGVPISMPGADRVYSITIGAGITTIVVNMDNVVDGNDNFAELIFLGNTCSTTNCSTSEQYDIANGTFLNGTNTATFAAVGPGTFYFVVDAQSSDGIYEYDISFDCFSSGIAFDNDGCVSGGFNDASDGDLNGIVPRVNGSYTNLTMNACATYTICHRFYIENLTNFEWLDHIQMNLGSCFTSITNVTNPGAGQYQPGNWVATTGPGTIDWEFTKSGANPGWGDGTGGSYNCQISRIFCFDATISPGCTNGLDLVIGMVLTDDGIGGTGATVVGTTVGASDNFVLGAISPTANAGPDGSVCSNNPYTLAGTIGGTASSSTWTTSGTGTFSNATSLTSTYTASANDVIAGSVILTLTTNDPAGFCGPAVDQMTLIFDPPALINAGADQAVCSLAPVNLAGTDIGAFVTVTWTTSGTGTFSDATSLTSTYTPSIADDAAGSITLTLTSSDPAGLCGPMSDQMVLTFDNTNPTITCPANQTTTTSAGTCSRSFATPNPTVTDNCSASTTWATTGATVLSGAGNVGTQTFNLGVTTVTYTATDLLGNVSTCSFTVTVTDNQNPTVTCPANISANTGAGVCTASVASPNPTTADNCSVASLSWATTGATVLSGTNNIGTQTFNIGVTTVTYTVTDASGRTGTCSYTVTVTDNINPTVTCPANIAANTGAGVCTASVASPNPTTADNCSVASLSWATTGATVLSGANNIGTQTFNLGVTTITYTVTDAAGRTGTCSYTVTVTDNINPTVTCPANIAANTGAGVCTASVASPNPTTADNCSVASLSWATTGATVLSGTNNIGTQTFNIGVTTVTYTVTDASGRTGTCSYTVTVTDNQNPTITCPGAQTVIGNATCQGTLGNYVGMATTSDNCGVLSVTQSPVAGTLFVGSQVVTLTVTDINGRTNTCTFTVTVVDNTPPTITCPAAQTGNVNASCQFALLNYTGMATAADNCGAPTVTQSPAAGTLVGVGTTVVTLTATDANSNVATCTFNVVVTDVTNPTVTCPANIAANTGAGVCTASVASPNPTTADNCSVASLSWATTGATVLSGVNNIGTQTFNIGVTTVTYTVTDASGRTGTCSYTVTVTDNQNPTITCPGAQTVIGNATCQGTLGNYVGMATTSDNCGVLSVTQSPVAGTLFVGSQVVTLTVTDINGRTNTCTFTVTVVDNTPPTITCPAAQTGNVNASCQFALLNYTGMATAADNCGAPTVTQSPAAGTLVGVGTTVITLTATDANSNVATCTFNVVVTDATPPSVTCPGNQTLNVNATCNASVPDYTTAITSDNCGVATLTQSPAAGTVLTGHGTVQAVTLTVTDINGLTNTCTFNITLQDVTPPTITCPANQTVAANASCQFTMLSYTGMTTTTDNCAGAVTLTQSPVAGTVVSGTQVVTMTATDAAGNISTCTFQVIVIDNTPPVISSGCPANQTVNANATCGYTLPSYTGSLTVTDNCTTAGALTIVQSPIAGTVLGLGVTPVTVTVTDANGNSVVCSFNVTVNDVTLPTIVNCPVNQNLNIVANCDVALPDFTSTLTVTDNCSPVGSITVVQSPVAGTVLSGDGTVQTVTLTVTDLAGNISTCTFDVTVVDVTNPTIVTCTPNQNELPDANCQFTMLDYTSLMTVTDNCDAAGLITITQSPAVGVIISGTTTVTLTATDLAGNFSTCTFDVILTDGTPPTITSGCPANFSMNADATCGATLADFTGALTVTDNCNLSASIVITQSPAIGTTLPLGVNTITLTATDANGNASTCTFDITVVDNTLPTIVNCPVNQNLNIVANCDVALPDFTSTLTVTDNCSPVGSITVVQSPVAGTVLTGNGTVQTVTLTVTDLAGNISTCTFDVTVTDVTNPTIVVCPPNQNEIPNASCQFVMTDYTSLMTVTDNCTAPGLITITQSPAVGATISGTTTVTLTADDGNGNTATCTFDVILTDGTPPTITSGCPANFSMNADATCGATLADFTGSLTVTDNCNLSASIVITQSPAIGTTLPLGLNTITLTATDANGNASNCTFDITVVDATLPTIVNCPVNQNLNIVANCDVALPDFTSTLTVTDNCSPVGSITVVQSPVAGTVLTGNGTVQTVTLTVTDLAGNISTCTFDVTVTDVTNPTIVVCPPNQNEIPNASCQFVMTDYTSLMTVTDNCTAPGLITITQSPAVGATISGTTTVTLTADDGNGNTATCTFDVILTDGTPPTITSGCPANFSMNADATCGATLADFTGALTVTDNCNLSASIVITQSPAIGTTLPLGVNTITLTATDANGNASTCTFDITVVDNTLPTIVNCPVNQNLNIVANCDVALPDFTSTLTVTDNCSPVGSITVVQSPVAGTVLSGDGTVQTVTLTVTDLAGNISTCTFDVTVVDVTNPTIVTCTPNQNELPDANCQFTMLDYTSLMTVTDNCDAAGLITITQSPAVGVIISGTTTVTLTATDLAGNFSTCTFDVILTDGTPPTITSGCPANFSMNADATCGATLADFTGALTVTDNCNLSASIVITQSPAIGTTLPLGVNTITLTATDANGNASTCTFDITVVDNTLPTIVNCPVNQNLNIVANCDVALPDFTSTLTVNDNCSPVGSITVVQSPVAGTVLTGNGTVQTVTLTVTDLAGNISTCAFDVTVVDVTNPTIVTCTPNQNENPDANCEFTMLDYTSLMVVTDNCDAAGLITITQSPAVGSIITGTTTVTLTATDLAGNFSTCTFDVILTDGTPPTITSGCPANFSMNADATCGATLADFTGALTVTDNCNLSASIVITQSPAIGTTLPLGINTITLTATDANGNASTCTFDITVVDVTAPTIVCPSDIISCDPLVTYVAPIGIDNCSGSVTTQTDVTGLSSGSTFPIGVTTLTYTVTDGAGNNVSCSFNVTVVDITIQPDAGADLILCEDDIIPSLNGTTASGGTLTWFDDATLTNTVGTGTSFIPFDISGTTTYYLTESLLGCNTNPDTINVTIEMCDSLYIPTGFTPDGDGANDEWVIPGLNVLYPNNTVQVYGRWGGLLFESQGYATPWDGTNNGKKMPLGSYYFVIDLGDESEAIKGTVTIIE